MNELMVADPENALYARNLGLAQERTAAALEQAGLTTAHDLEYVPAPDIADVKLPIGVFA